MALEKGFEIQSIDRKIDSDPLTHQFIGKLENKNELSEILQEISPDYVVHLAAESSILNSWVSPTSTILSNVTATKNLVDAIKSHPRQLQFINISSSSVYAPKRTGRIAETDQIGPDNPYAISKFACELSIAELKSYINVRPFFIIGPEKKGDVVSDWCQQIANLENHDPANNLHLVTGNLDIVRDFISVRTAAEGLLYLMTSGTSNETYNLCSGRGVSLRLVVNHLQDISRVRFDVLSNSQEKLRKNDRIRVVGNPEKLSKLGFLPKIQLKSVLKDILDWHRTKCGN